MSIGYYAKADALYLTLISGDQEVGAKSMDKDMALNFDEKDRLVGIEVLGGSKRIELRNVLPAKVVEVGDS